MTDREAVFTLANYDFETPIGLAPIAGVSDRVFRELCIRHGADYTVSEMIGSNPRLRTSEKTRRRLDHRGTRGIRIMQIAGADPVALADAARHCVAQGAEVVDINMGCPAKKVCNKLAGSALMRDEPLVAALFNAVVAAVAVPVTVKMRTGWDVAHRNAPRIAHLAESLGIQLVTIHGRTRSCGFKGDAEYDTIAQVKSDLNIPVIANGDICSSADALAVLRYTNCDGLLVGRAAYGNPWIFAEIKTGLVNGVRRPPPSTQEVHTTMLSHVLELHNFYGQRVGTRVARKHVGWYASHLNDGGIVRRTFNHIESASGQLDFLKNYHNDPQGALAA